MNINGKIRLFCSIHLLSALFLGAGTVWHVVITPCGGISHSSRTHLPLRSQLRGDMMMNMIHINMELGIGAPPRFSVLFFLINSKDLLVLKSPSTYCDKRLNSKTIT